MEVRDETRVEGQSEEEIKALCISFRWISHPDLAQPPPVSPGPGRLAGAHAAYLNIRLVIAKELFPVCHALGGE